MSSVNITPYAFIMNNYIKYRHCTDPIRIKQMQAYRVLSNVEQELPTLPSHLSSPPVFSGVRVTRSLVLCVSRSLFVLL